MIDELLFFSCRMQDAGQKSKQVSYTDSNKEQQSFIFIRKILRSRNLKTINYIFSLYEISDMSFVVT